MWTYLQAWLPVMTIVLTAAICFGGASFMMKQVPPRP